jgi:hypothetical protein
MTAPLRIERKLQELPLPDLSPDSGHLVRLKEQKSSVAKS